MLLFKITGKSGGVGNENGIEHNFNTQLIPATGVTDVTEHTMLVEVLPLSNILVQSDSQRAEYSKCPKPAESVV